MKARGRPQSSIHFLAALIVYLILLNSSVPDALASPPMPAPDPQAPTISTLEQDARLKHLVIIHAVGVTLDDLLNRLSTNGLSLSAGRSSGSQKLQIRLNRKPVRVLMQSLAQLLAGNWKPNDDGSGYFFTQSPETIARREKWWQLFLNEQERAKQAQRRFILQKMQVQPVPHKIYDGQGHTPEHEAKAEEVRDLECQDFFYTLSPALQARIANQIVDYSFMGFQGGREEGALVVPLTEISAQSQTLLLAQFSHPDPANVLVRFNNSGFDVTVGAFTFEGSGVPPRTADTFISLHAGLCPDACVLPLYHPELVNIVQKLGDKAPLAWKELAAYQERRVWPNDSPQTPPSADFPPRGRYRADVLDWLADQADADFVADYYTQRESQPMNDEEKAHPLTGNIKEELDVVARDQDVSWHRTEEGIYLIRNNRWYRDDKLEIPTAWLQRWLRQLEALKVDPTARQKGSKVHDPDADPTHLKARMDWEADIASKLADWQIPSFVWAAMERTMASPMADQVPGFSVPAASMPASSAKSVPAIKEIGFPFMAVGVVMMQELGMARFYASLNEAQREALVAGQLSLASLSPAQQQQALYLSPTLPYWADRQPVWLELQSQLEGFAIPANLPGVLFLNSFHLVAIPVH